MININDFSHVNYDYIYKYLCQTPMWTSVTCVCLEELIFIATERGLFAIDLRSKKLLEHYDFLFLRDIIEINYFSDFLVLLTRDGLVKFNMEL